MSLPLLPPVGQITLSNGEVSPPQLVLANQVHALGFNSMGEGSLCIGNSTSPTPSTPGGCMIQAR